jgi:thiol-disulfide isomerase/thioredoxin
MAPFAAPVRPAVLRRLLGGLAVLALLAGCTSDGRELPDVDVAAAAAGASAPDGVLVDGGWPEVAAYVEESAATGQATVVNIFASWCAPCERELPLLLERSASTTGVRWLGVASEDRRVDAEPFVDRLEVTWPSVLDPPATTHIALEGVAMPTTAFFDPDGELVSVVIGELDAARLDAELARIIP